MTDLCFSPDSKMLVSAGGYLKVRVSQRLKEKNSLYPTFQIIFTSCVSVGPCTTHQRGRAMTVIPFWVMRLRSARLHSSDLLEVLMAVLGMFSVQSSHPAPNKVLGEQND